ncbi:hypothetical protein BX667DRAFT_517594 [Coemansia mojavensis]|nr:hypothetical protein BX667DRAFT_517594 [Coemansia mojavensis]
MHSNKYTLYVQGVGKDTASKIEHLKVGGKNIEQVLIATNQSTVWLDIESPTIGDAHAIISVFKIHHTIAQRMHQVFGRFIFIEPAYRQTHNETYICWPEMPLMSGNSALCNKEEQLWKIMEHTWSPFWLNTQQSGQQAYQQRQQRLEQIVNLLDRSKAHTLSQHRWVLRRWGYDRWRSILHSEYQQRISRRNTLVASKLPLDMFACQANVVQIWTSASIVVTLHAQKTPAITQTMQKLNTHMDALSIIHSMIGVWVRKSRHLVGFLHSYSDQLAEAAVQQTAASNPYAHSAQKGHRLALWLLRYSQSSFHVLCRLHNRHKTTGLFAVLKTEQRNAVDAYRHTEQMLAQLSKVLFARTRYHFLLTGKSILDSMNWCLVES